MKIFLIVIDNNVYIPIRHCGNTAQRNFSK